MGPLLQSPRLPAEKILEGDVTAPIPWKSWQRLEWNVRPLPPRPVL